MSPPPLSYTYRLGLRTSLPKLIVNGGQVRLQMNILSPWTKRWVDHFFLVEYLLSTVLRLKICFPLIKIKKTTMITKINNSSKRTRLFPVYNGYLFFFKFTTLIRTSWSQYKAAHPKLVEDLKEPKQVVMIKTFLASLWWTVTTHTYFERSKFAACPLSTVHVLGKVNT